MSGVGEFDPGYVRYILPLQCSSSRLCSLNTVCAPWFPESHAIGQLLTLIPLSESLSAARFSYPHVFQPAARNFHTYSPVNNRERTSEDPPTTPRLPSSPCLLLHAIPKLHSSIATAVPLARAAPGKGNLEILENLKSIIKDGQHEFYRAVPQPAALASIYMGHIPQGQTHPDQYPSPRSSLDLPVDNGNVPDISLSNVPFRRLTHLFSHLPLPQTIESHTPFGCRHVTQQIRRRGSQHLRFQPAPCPARLRGHLHNSRTSSRHQHGHYG